MSRDLQQSGIAPGLIQLQLVVAASLLTQGVADVEGPMGVSPIGVPGVGVHPSGSGKTSMFRVLTAPIVEVLDTLPTRMQGFLLEDATREAVVASMLDCSVAGIFTDEGGQIKSMLGVGAPTIAKLMDGSGVRHARISNGNGAAKDIRVSISNPRLTALVLSQPEIWEQLKVRMGAGEGGQGLANRFIWDDSAAWTLNHYHSLGLSDSVREAYGERIRSLLGSTYLIIQGHQSNRPVLRLASESDDYLRYLRSAIFPGVPSEYASRHAQRSLRIAGALHVFEHGAEGEICLEFLRVAEAIDRASTAAYARLTYVPPKLSQEDHDAQTLVHAFSGFAPNTTARLSDIRRDAVNIGLTKARFNRALPVVCRQGYAWVYLHEGEEWVQLQPRFRTVQTMPLVGGMSH
jgi:hypothetical protein